MTVSTCTEKEYLIKFKVVSYTLVKSSICRCLIQIIWLKKLRISLGPVITLVPSTHVLISDSIQYSFYSALLKRWGARMAQW